MGTPVTFVSKRRELRIIVKPSDRTFDEARRPVIIRGEKVEFVNHRYTTSDDALSDWLKHHYLYNKEYTSAEVAKPSPPPVEMVQGANTTVSRNPSRKQPQEKVQELGPTNPPDTPVTWEEIDEKMNEKFDTLLERFSSIMQSQAKEEVTKPKKVFTCPVEGCGMVFKSGIDVGRHKKLAHLGNG